MYVSGTLSLIERIDFLAETLVRHGVEMRLEDFRPTESICFRFEVKFKGLKPFVMVDAVRKEIFLARFAATDAIHFVKIVQVGYCRASVCQS